MPFAELWRPWTSAARRRFEALCDLAPIVPRGDLDRLATGLGREVARLSERATYELFSDDRARLPLGSGAYSSFVDRLLGAGLQPLYAEYPVLLRQTELLVESWAQSLAELLVRWQSDREAISVELGGRAERLIGVERLASDRHGGGRGVFRCELEGGLELIYKPRSVAPERAWNGFLDWMRGAGCDDTPPSARVLERTGYGWMASIRRSDPESDRERARWYRRAGALIAISDLLGVEDLHAENLIATRAGPVAVDLELLLRPASAPRDLERGSVFASGLLAAPGGRARDRVGRWAGLEPVLPDAGHGQRRGWAELGTDKLRPLLVAREAPELSHLPRRDGAPLRVAEFGTELLAGFTAAYRFLLARRDELLAERGALAALAGIPVRVLFRPSQEYAQAIDLLTDPGRQRDGVAGGLLLEAGLRPFAAQLERPRLWTLVAEERAALEDLDLPRFEIGSDSTVLSSARHEPVADAFHASGLARARRRFELWSEPDLEHQRAAIARSLAPATAVLESSGTAESATAASARTERFAAAALALGRAIAERRLAAVPEPLAPAEADLARGVRRLSLYDGLAGETLLLAALARVGEDPRVESAAALACKSLVTALSALEASRETPIGGLQGVGSWIWSLVAMHRWVTDDALLEVALRLAASLDEERLTADRRLDIEGGLAGGLLALLALHQATGERGALESARAAGELLLARAEEVAGGVAWCGEIGRPLAGFAHGAAGIARALAALGMALGDRRFEEAARAALAFEATLFDAARGNWRVVLSKGAQGEPRATWMTAWCHGAPGIGLSRALLDGDRFGPRRVEELEVAMATTAAAGVSGDDHLCCGGAGRAAILALAAALERRSDWRSAAESIALAMLDRAAERGDYALPAPSDPTLGAEWGLCPQSYWGLMRGRSGLAWLFLELSGQALPSPLALELPDEFARRQGERP